MANHKELGATLRIRQFDGSTAMITVHKIAISGKQQDTVLKQRPRVAEHVNIGVQIIHTRIQHLGTELVTTTNAGTQMVNQKELGATLRIRQCDGSTAMSSVHKFALQHHQQPRPQQLQLQLRPQQLQLQLQPQPQQQQPLQQLQLQHFLYKDVIQVQKHYPLANE